MFSMKSTIRTSGTKKWEFTTGNQVWSCPAIGADGTVYVGSDDNKLYALFGDTALAASPWPKFRHDLKNSGRKP